MNYRLSQTLSADPIFFPAAAIFAMLTIPSWMAMVEGWIPLPGLYWHGHEMLFGYALAVVSGYLITRASLVMLGLLFVSWLAARLAALGLMGAGLFAALPGLIFAGLVVNCIAPPFLRAAKKAENRVFGPLFIGIGACELVYQLGHIEVLPGAEPFALLIAVDLFALLLLLMGGRVIAPAVAGYFYRSGGVLAARVQPRLERMAIGLMIGMLLLDLIPNAGSMGGVFALGAAAVTGVRLWRWRLWGVLEQPHLWALGLGYLWLVPALALKGWAQVVGRPDLNWFLHGITVGALGTLTLVMMARIRLQRSRQGLGEFKDMGAAALLVSLAAVLRLGAPLAGGEYTSLFLWGSAAAWSIAFGLLLRCLILFPRNVSEVVERGRES
ncbi:NnrS family protein [Nitrosococcus halophilus Nc 4]|uniref:NnrS family protein n=1 Tax=Nitrosococcus halophilus (strain Nc4) TaxID=472759 RepID=D5BY40_NITHN|nr:NnrS family protein [Nitrosococcus halophilus]ADE15951.1 NnrS family protein [Nitrosococcus halophilus Nc 4]